MAILRLAGIPFDHIEAELAALPIASEASFLSPTVVLDPVTCRQKGLWRAAERDILASIPSVPLDEFAAIRDRLWFGQIPEHGGTQTKIALVLYLRNLAQKYLDPLGRPIELASQSTASEGPSPRTRLRWSWLCRALPPDLLRTARNIEDADYLPYPLNPMVERLLQESGFAETHLHLGASVDFSLLWANLMHALAVEEMLETSMGSPGACFGDGTKFAKWIMWAAVLRLVLAEWLFGSGERPDCRALLNFTTARWEKRMDAGMKSDLRRLISEFARGNEGFVPLGFARGRAIYRSLIHPLPFGANRWEERERLRAHRQPENRKEVLQNDPLARVVGWRGTCEASPETIFVRKSLSFMEENEEGGDFAHLFWQVIRIRCLLYRHLVQRPLTPGLQWFVRSFSRIRPVRQSLPDAVSMATASRQSGSGRGLKSLEVRLGTEKSVSQCLSKIQQVNDVETNPCDVEVGAVFHFSRDRGGGWRQGVPNAHGLDHSYPGIPRDEDLRTCQDAGNPSGFRFARFYLEQRRHAQALVTVLRNFPSALRTVRGVDLCTDEAGVPIWVMAPLIRWVRETGECAAMKLRRRGIADIPPLRTTVHAGEDFVHLLTGLRRLDEAIRHLGLEEGDRIGHGLALGLDPAMWVKRTGRIVQTREERLFDLTWEWDCYANLGVDVESVRLAYLHSTITELARKIFDKTLAPEDLISLVKGLHNQHQLKIQGFPCRSGFRTLASTWSGGSASNSQILMQEFLRSTEVWWRGRVLETISLDDLGHELRALHRLQRALQHEVGKLGLTVEVNPSSNLMIADLGFLEEHPIWRLMPFQPIDDIPPISVCVGSDDPLTFATNLPHEYQLLFDTVVLAGQSHEVALGWLDKAREAGMRGRFTLPRSITRCPEKLVPSVFQDGLPIPPP